MQNRREWHLHNRVPLAETILQYLFPIPSIIIGFTCVSNMHVLQLTPESRLLYVWVWALDMNEKAWKFNKQHELAPFWFIKQNLEYLRPCISHELLAALNIWDHRIFEVITLYAHHNSLHSKEFRPSHYEWVIYGL